MVVPRRPVLDGLEPKLVQGQPRRRHGDPSVGVAAEDPDPEPAGDELADYGQCGEGSVVPLADRIAAVRPVVADPGHVGVQRRLDVGPVEIDLGVLLGAGIVACRLHDPPMVFGEDPGGGAVDGDLPVAAARRRRRAGVGADGGVEAVHVDEAVHSEVLVQRGVTRVRHVGHAEVAVGLDVAVYPVGEHGVIPGVLDHARLVRLVVHQRVPDHEPLEVDVVRPGGRLVAVEDLL
uniref:Uncharacterized protein n=1 Tax=Arundo donax TaxID=35708 RepID=A0A0A9D084_ARUDO